MRQQVAATGLGLAFGGAFTAAGLLHYQARRRFHWLLEVRDRLAPARAESS